MKILALEIDFAYNFGVYKNYTPGPPVANSWKALRGPVGPDSLADSPHAGLNPRRFERRFESMTYILYRVLRRLPRPLLAALLVVLMTALARAGNAAAAIQ